MEEYTLYIDESEMETLKRKVWNNVAGYENYRLYKKEDVEILVPRNGKK